MIVVRIFLLVFAPFLVFFTMKKYAQGVFCFILQLTLIGWLPAFIWSLITTINYDTDKKLKEAFGKQTGKH